MADSTQLQIVLSLIDDASEALASAQDAFSSFAEGASTAVSEASDQMTVSIEGVQYASVEAAQAMLDSMDSAGAEMSEAITVDFDEAAQAASDAALLWTDTWDASIANLQETMAAATDSVVADTATMATAGTEAGAKLESSMSSLGGKFVAVGVQLGILGAAFTGFAASAVTDAGKQADAFDQLGNTVTNVYNSAGTGNAGYSTQVADLTAKIDTAQASIDKAAASTSKFGTTTQEMGATQAAAGASIETANINIAKYQQELDQLEQSQSLVGGSASDTATQLEALAKSSTNLGFNVTDSASALQYLFSSTNSVAETQSAFQDAMDLSAKTGDSLSTSANLVIQAMSGMGRGLRDLGVNVADGLSGQTALAAIQEKVAGAAQDAATHGLGPYNVAQAKMNQLMSDFGTTALPALSSFLTILSQVITQVDAWVVAHPKLSAAILEFTAIVGAALIVLAVLVIILAGAEILVSATEAAFTSLGIATTAAAPALGLVALAFIAIAVIIVIVIEYHKQLFTWLQQTGIITTFETAWKSITNLWNTVLLPAFKEMWTMIQPWIPWFQSFASILGDELALAIKAIIIVVTVAIELFALWLTGVIGLATFFSVSLVGAVNDVIKVFTSLWQLIQNISTSLQKIGGAAGTAISGAVQAAIPHFATGGIVSSPTIALVGEAGPEAIIPLSAFDGGGGLARGGSGGGSSSGSIVVNINGGMFLNSSGATTIAAAITKNIQRNLKLRSI